MADDMMDIKHERLFRYSFLCYFFLYPIVSFASDFLGIESSVLSILSRAIQLGFSFYYLFFLLRCGRFRVSSFQIILFTTFWLIYSVRIIHDTVLHPDQLGKPPSLYYLFAFFLSFIGILPFFAVAPVNLEKLEWQILQVSFGLTLLGLYNTLHADVLFIVRVGGNEKLNPITTGLIAILVVIIPIKRLLITGGNKIWHWIFYLISIALGLVTLLIVSTKIVFISIAFIIVLMVGYLIANARVKALLGISAFLFAIVTFIIVGGYSAYFILTFQRFDDITGDESTQIRINLLQGAWRQFKESPIFGSFLEEKVYQFHPHNIMLESLMAVGIVGTVFLVLFYLDYVYQAVSSMYKTKFNAISLMAITQSLVALTSSSLSYSPEFWLATAVISWLPLAMMHSASPTAKLQAAMA